MQLPIGRKFVPVAIALAIAIVAARAYWPSDVRDVRRRLAALAEVASVPANETDVERLVRMAQLGKFFTDDVILRSDVSSFVGGRQAVVGLARQGAETYGRMTVSFGDVQVALTHASEATVYMTLGVSGDKAEALEPRQVSVTFVHVNGEWLVSRGEVLRTLESTPPSTPLGVP